MANTVGDRTKMRRIAKLHVDISGIQMHTMCYERIVSMEVDEDDVFVIKAQHYKKPMRLQKTHCDPKFSKEWKKTFASLNMCQTVILWNLEWILWLTESEYLESLTRSVLTKSEEQGLEIQEVSFEEPCPRRRFRCVYIDNDFRTKSEECEHAVLMLTSASSGESVISDPSYAQYSFEKGVEDLDDYTRNNIQAYTSARDVGLGSSVEVWREGKASRWKRAREDIITKTVNNIVFEEIEQLGGTQMFLNLGAREFKEAKNRILARVRKELKALRHELDDIMYRLVKDVEALHTLRRDCDGIGNKSCQAAYNRKVKSNP